MKTRADPSQPFLNQSDLNWIISQLYLRRVQLEALAEDMQSIQQALSHLLTRVTILEDQWAPIRKRAHNKAHEVTCEAELVHRSFLHRMDD